MIFNTPKIYLGLGQPRDSEEYSSLKPRGGCAWKLCMHDARNVIAFFVWAWPFVTDAVLKLNVCSSINAISNELNILYRTVDSV